MAVYNLKRAITDCVITDQYQSHVSMCNI